VSDRLLYLALSILISLVLQSDILFDFFLFIEVLEYINYLIYVFSLKFSGHRQIVLEHMSCLSVLRVYYICPSCMLRLR
jgi:hypothetical protein